jgi:hypothetical protein
MENLPARTLTVDSAGDRLATAGKFAGRVWSALRAFGKGLQKQQNRARGESRPVTAERAAAMLPSPWTEPGELPETYGRTKVVAMVVSPYLIHVYWDLSPKDQAQSGPASLRFYDTAAGGSFDVNVDLAVRNWYVHLWSPDKRYSIELGLQRAGGFAPLARSNPIETPRAWPVTEVQQVSDLPARPVAVSPAAPPAPPSGSPTPATSAAQPPVQPAPPVPGTAVETLRRRLSELYGFRRWQRPPASDLSAAPEKSFPAEPAAAAEATGLEAGVDFTARLETQFCPGLSSVLLGLAPRKKPVG